MNQQKPADPTVFEDTDRQTITITEQDLLGTHTFTDVLYTGDSDVVDVTIGETPPVLDKTVQEAKDFAKRTTDEGRAPRVAKAQPTGRAIESRTPYVSSAFFHKDMTGGLDWHTVFRKAWESDAYTVTHTADYTTGTLTITIAKTPNPNSNTVTPYVLNDSPHPHSETTFGLSTRNPSD